MHDFNLNSIAFQIDLFNYFKSKNIIYTIPSNINEFLSHHKHFNFIDEETAFMFFIGNSRYICFQIEKSSIWYIYLLKTLKTSNRKKQTDSFTIKNTIYSFSVSNSFNFKYINELEKFIKSQERIFYEKSKKEGLNE